MVKFGWQDIGECTEARIVPNGVVLRIREGGTCAYSAICFVAIDDERGSAVHTAAQAWIDGQVKWWEKKTR